MDVDQLHTSTDQFRNEFDDLTKQMVSIEANASLAPDSHKQLHKLALLLTYDKAYRLIESQPGVAQDMDLECSESVDDYQELVSVRQLHGYGIPEISLEISSLIPRPEDINTAHGLASRRAFSELFASAVRIEEVTPDEQFDEGNSEDDVEEDDEDAVNTLDVMELLEESEFSESQRAYISYALQNGPFNVRDMRKTVWEIIALSKTEYEAFEKSFRTFGYEAALFLRTAGIPAKFEVLLKPKGAVQLMIGKSADTAEHTRTGLDGLYGKDFDRVSLRQNRQEEANAEPEDSEVETVEIISLAGDMPPARVEVSRVHINQAKALGFIQEALTQHTSDHPPRLTVIGKALSEEFGITHAEALGQIKQYVDEGQLFYGHRHKGSRTLSLVYTERVRHSSANRSAKEREATQLTVEDLEVAHQAFQALLGAGHQNKGLTLRSMCIATGIDETTLRNCLNKLADAGALHKDKAWVRSRSPHSRKKESQFYKFKSQEAWLAYKANPTSFVGQLIQH